MESSAIRGQLFEDRHSRKRVPATTSRLFALRFKPRIRIVPVSNCACLELPVSNCLFARSLELLRLTPAAQQDCKVGRVDHAVVIEVGGASSALAP